MITGNSGVAEHVPPGRIMMGYPAVRMDQNVEMCKALSRLPRLLARLEGKRGAPRSDGALRRSVGRRGQRRALFG